MNHQCTQVAIAPLADPEEQAAASAGVLSRYQTQPGGQLATTPELLRVT